MRQMRKRGFTLIELLAVIVILAIIALIATPIILGVIDKAKQGAAKSSAQGYIKAIENTVLLRKTDKNTAEINDGFYEVNDLEIPIKGDGPIEGWYTIQKGQVTSYKLKVDEWWFSSGDKPDINFESIGTNVIVNDEKYYIDDQITIKIETPNYLFTKNDASNSNDLFETIKITLDGVLLTQEEVDNMKGDKLNLYLLQISESGIHTIDVQTEYKDIKNNKSYTVKIDNDEPTISANDNPKSLTQIDYDFASNVTTNFGISGGNITCDPSASLKQGVYDVTCIATSNNNKTKEVTFQVKHSYAAKATTTTSSVRCGHWDPIDGSAGGGTCSYKRFRCTGCGTITNSYTCADDNGGGWGNGDHYKTVSTTRYSCPNGGTLNDKICYY